MANTTAIASSFKQEIMQGTHNLGSNTIKAALYLTTASIGASTTAYTATGEVSGTGYTAGGITTTAGSVGLNGTVAYWQPGAALSFGTVTLSTAFDTVLLYNNTASNKAIASWNFGSTTVNNGTFTINLPTNDSTNALIRLS
jgi:hypothetical protein